ncbi:Sedlin [Fimicolochytrium jonesii]|uniref:Sedlin n=1 Tax=Fimicolochytrium jonesii TaxID=1396493 RepID=UPI0022FEC652|nr:Sedlin [Fimicolochytrium jonesii]KAI8823466.1 Sedlin [Fimicolochytrium jonesii]
MSSNSYFALVGTRDNPLYEAEWGPQTRNTAGDAQGGQNRKEEHKHLNQFIVHAALDVVEELMWGSTSMYLKIVDKFNEWYISAYVTASGAKFMLLHETSNIDGIRNFFQDTHELYIKTLLNPFTEINAPITSPMFDAKVKALARKWL